MVPRSHQWGFECRYCKHSSNSVICVKETPL
jgi:hypothetical protein